MSEEDLEPQITSRQQEWSLSFAQCLWDSTKAGIRFNSTYQISQEEHTAVITYRLYVW